MQPHLLNPKAQLKWRQCAHLPQAMVFAQAVTIRDTVYFGSGTSTLTTEAENLHYKIYKYNSTMDKWSPVPHCPVTGFGMVNFEDRLTLVGGAYQSQDDSGQPFSLTGDVHVYSRDCSKSERLSGSMSHPRLLPTVLTYGSTVVACGGIVLDAEHDVCVDTVEVYSQVNAQWYRAKPLPFACIGMTFSSINDYYYFLGGFTDTEFDHPTTSVFTVCLPRLIEAALVKGSNQISPTNGSADTNGSTSNGNYSNASSSNASSSNGSTSNGSSSPSGGSGCDSSDAQLWEKFTDSPRFAASLTTIGGCLVAIGGSDERLEHKSGALHVYSPLTTSWLRVDDIPVACFACTVSRLPEGELMIIGGMGHDEEDALKTVYRGRVSLD